MTDDPVRIGVDVGGTFTKAVALDPSGLVGTAIVATTHSDPGGVAAGVVEVVRQIVDRLAGREIAIVTHSTTQAVNALLEGDVGTVGVIGMGSRPDLRKARKRTTLDDIDVAPGRRLSTICEFIDVTGGLESTRVDEVLDRLTAGGATAICVAEAFATEDTSNEQLVVDAAAARGLPACASTDMSGLYGLELRAVTAALNASVLPIAIDTTTFVKDGVAKMGVTAPVMVMRGDGGATDLEGFRREPARTLYSGPAASVAGVLRHTRVVDGIVVEVGGTSTNVAAIKGGQPLLSYVRVASHATALRAIDVRVLGVAGGSMLRARKAKVYGVGPRSAHIAGLRYACFTSAEQFDGATTELFAPKPGDPADYLAIRCADGELVALTNTCAANALGVVHDDDYAHGDGAAARAAFAVAGAYLRLPADEVARRMLEASGTALAELIASVISDNDLVSPTLVAVGGGAGGLGRHVAALLRLDCQLPEGAEVISSIGDALSLVRAEKERTVAVPSADLIDQLAAEVRAELIAAGASATAIDVRVEHVPERSALRAVATGSVALRAGAVPGREAIDRETASRLLKDASVATSAEQFGSFWMGEEAAKTDTRLVVIDRFGDPVLDATGAMVRIDESSPQGPELLRDAIDKRTRHVGPIAVPPTAWVLTADQLTEVSAGDITTIALGVTAGRPACVLVSRGT